MTHLAAIAAGGALGALARYAVSYLVSQRLGPAFPLGTLAINVAGCWLLGLVAELAEGTLIDPALRSFLTVGFLGAFTTFSTFSLETINLLQDGEAGLALLNVAASVAAGLASCWLGMLAARLLMRAI